MRATRRQFLECASRTIVAAGMAGAPLSACRRVNAGTSRLSTLEFLRQHCGIFVSAGEPATGTIGFVLAAQGVVIVDSQYPDRIGVLLQALQSRGARAVDAVINTHHHRDHTSGNPVLHPVAKRIVAHDRVPEYLHQAANEDWPEAALVLPDVTFSESWSVNLGDELVSARHYGPAHTGGDVVVRFERANIVHLGDLVFNRLPPHIDRSHGGSATEWIHTLEHVIRDQPPDATYVFSHARPGQQVTGRRADVLLQRDYLTALLDRVRQGLGDGSSPAEIAKRVDLRSFPDHADYGEFTLLRSVVGMHEELTGGK